MSIPNINRAFRAKNGITINDDVFIGFLTFIPSDDGFDAPVGSIAITMGNLYQKVGEGLIDWKVFEFKANESAPINSFYFGAENIEGTWRIIKNSNDLEVSRYETDTYDNKVVFSYLPQGVDSTQDDSQTGHYFGDSLLNGSWRFVLRNGNLSIQRRELGIWYYKDELESATIPPITDSQSDSTDGIYVVDVSDGSFRIVRSGNNLNFEIKDSGDWKVYLEITP